MIAGFWWRTKRKTDHPIWHYMLNCEVLPWDKDRKFIKVDENPTSGTKCDFCQYCEKREKEKANASQTNLSPN